VFVLRTGQLAQQARRLAAYLDTLAERWIGYSLPPAGRVIEASDWAPDERDTYCPRCGDSVGPGEATDSGCGSCRDRPALTPDGVVRLGPYSGELRDWIIGIKYGRRWAEMAELLGRALGRAVRQADLIDIERAIVVPAPMPWQRRMYRGIDHARTIASGVARQLHAPSLNVLARANGPPQVSLSAGERARAGSRGLRRRRRIGGWPLNGLHLVLVDDVRTTGASLKAAARLLRPLKPEKVIGAVLAVSDDRARRERAAQGVPKGAVEAG
jgi:predicted amidophosphoribosyltransferase